MRAIIKNVHSPDALDVGTYEPKDPENFNMLFQFLIGPADSEGEESFDIEVCTPKWILTNHNKEDVVFGRYKIIVLEYNFQRIVSSVTKYVSTCSGETWSELSAKVSRIGRWEFEDYRPSGPEGRT